MEKASLKSFSISNLVLMSVLIYFIAEKSICVNLTIGLNLNYGQISRPYSMYYSINKP